MSAIYLDHAATTRVRPEVLAAMLPFYTERFGNPSSTHGFGREARLALEDARERVAGALGALHSEIVFTSGGTESDNLAVLGRARLTPPQATPVVACSAVEHKAVLSAVIEAARDGATSVIVGVDSEARVEPGAIEQVLQQRPVVLSVMWVNNEVGTIQPIEWIADQCAQRDVVLHTDAVQAFGRVPVRVRDGIGLLSLSGHKLGAPKGVGALYVRDGVELAARQHGGSQERGVRPGTQNIAAAIGMATAVELADAERTNEATRLGRLRERLEQKLRAHVSDLVVNGVNAPRAPHILSVSVPGLDQDALLVSLDLAGIAVSTASACQSGAAEPSHVLVAMGRNLTDGAVLRLSLGSTTTDDEIERAGHLIADIVSRVRSVAA